MSLVKGLTKYSSLGQYMISKELEKNKSFNKLSGNKKGNSIDLMSENGIKMLAIWAKSNSKQ